MMAYSKAKFKNNGDKSYCFRSYWTGNASHRSSPMRTLLYVSLKLILFNLIISWVYQI